MSSEQLQEIIEKLRPLEALFEDSTNSGTPILNSQNRATFKSLLMEVKAILDRNVGFANDFSQRLYSIVNSPSFGIFSPPSLSEFHEALAIIAGGSNELQRRQSTPQRALGSLERSFYVDPVRVSELQSLQTRWDLKRLDRLLKELNLAHANEMHMATAMLVRAITDHIAPIFDKRSFSELANHYPGAKSFNDQMKHLDSSLRKIADSHLHQQVRASEVLPTATQVDFRPGLDVLLAEIVRVLKTPR
jgi:hypothetical protein